jgi:hypothetical protein
MKLYMFRTFPLSVTVHTAMLYVIQVCWDFASCQKTCITDYFGGDSNKANIPLWKNYGHFKFEQCWRPFSLEPRTWRMSNLVSRPKRGVKSCAKADFIPLSCSCRSRNCCKFWIGVNAEFMIKNNTQRSQCWYLIPRSRVLLEKLKVLI